MDEAREGWHQRTPWFTGYEPSVDCDGPAVPVRSSENSNLRSSCPKTTKRVVVVISYREAGVLRAAIRQLFLLLVIVFFVVVCSSLRLRVPTGSTLASTSLRRLRRSFSRSSSL